MNNNTVPLTITDRNTHLPFFPSESWELTSSDFVPNTNIPGGYIRTFNWIQAFFDSASYAGPYQLAVWSGKYLPSGSRIVNIVSFAFSGEMIPFKGEAIVAVGNDLRGTAITSSPIGTNPATDLLQVIAYGGAL